MKISIAMATYNGGKYIGAQLQSFIDQTHRPDELIITDDCSTDETEAIVREFAKQAPFKVKYFRNPKNLGYCGNFNAALMKTCGDLVFLSDQDDVWFPEKIEHMVEVANQHPETLLLMNDAALTDGGLNEVGLTKIGQIRSAGLSMDNFVMGCCCAVRREHLNLFLPIPLGVKAHDNWLVDTADGIESKWVEKKVLQYYRRHEVNASHYIASRTKKVTKLDRFIESFHSIRRNDNVEKIRENINQLRVFSGGVARVSESAPEHYQRKLEALQQNIDERICTQVSRLAIRESKTTSRVVGAIRLLRKGSYTSSNSNGLKSFVRDLLG